MPRHETSSFLSWQAKDWAGSRGVILSVSLVPRYAGLYFCICVDISDNNLFYLEAIHNFVEVEAVRIF